MAIISFKETPLLKRGTWLSAAAMVVFVAAPSMLSGEMRSHSAINLRSCRRRVCGQIPSGFSFWRRA
jgi:hypothetical protein